MKFSRSERAGRLLKVLLSLASLLFSVVLSCTKRDPERSNAYLKQGNEFVKAYHYKQALEAYKEAARLDPENAEAFFGLGLTHQVL